MYDAATERAHRKKLFLMYGTDAIESDAEPYHVELGFGEALDGCAVGYVVQDVVVGKCGGQTAAQFVEQGDL